MLGGIKKIKDEKIGIQKVMMEEENQYGGVMGKMIEEK